MLIGLGKLASDENEEQENEVVTLRKDRGEVMKELEELKMSMAENEAQLQMQLTGMKTEHDELIMQLAREKHENTDNKDMLEKTKVNEDELKKQLAATQQENDSNKAMLDVTKAKEDQMKKQLATANQANIDNKEIIASTKIEKDELHVQRNRHQKEQDRLMHKVNSLQVSNKLLYIGML